MASYQVTCINKPDRNSRHEHITHIGGVSAGKRWKITREEAIRRIDSKTDSFYVVDARMGTTSWVGVVRPASGSPHLRTHANGAWNDNLLSLVECPLA